MMELMSDLEQVVAAFFNNRPPIDSNMLDGVVVEKAQEAQQGIFEIKIEIVQLLSNRILKFRSIILN